MFKNYTLHFLIIFSLLTASFATAQVSHDEIISNLQDYLRRTPNEAEIATHLANINPDGSWPDLDYSRTSGAWHPRFHLDRLLDFSRAYTDPESTYYNDTDIYNATVNGLQYYYDVNPTNDNWWSRQILAPRLIGRILLFMRAGGQQVPAQLENNILTRLENIRPAQSNFTGANKVDISLWRLYVGLLRDNETAVQTAVNDAYSTAAVTTAEGIQHDFSFFQHGQMFLPMHYGQILLNTLNDIAVPLVGSQYEFAGHPNFEGYTNFLLGSYATTRRGQFVSFSSVGRQIASQNPIRKGRGAYDDAKIIDPDNADAYQKIIDRATGNAGPETEDEPYNKYYHRALFTSHSRPDYKFTVLSNNYRVKKTEMGNGENIQGQFLSEGATNIMVFGFEYNGIFPVWEWNKIPGTTTPEYSRSKLRPRQDWGFSGSSRFTGGVSDGIYGANVFDMNEFGTQARKSWFMFDEEIVALGSGISSSETEAISTTVNQTSLLGRVEISENETSSTLENGDYTYENGLDWILHAHVGYFFPNQEKLRLTTGNQIGAEFLIRENASTNQINRNVFKLWFDHGVKPKDDTYSYIITPGKSSVEEMESYDMNNIKILENSKDIQAVKHEGLDMIQVIFYRPKIVEFDGIKIGVEKPTALILKNVSTSEIEVFVSDPAEENSEIEIGLETDQIYPFRKITAEMPSTNPTRGSTVNYIFNEETPEGTIFIEEPVVYEYVEDFQLMPGNDGNQITGLTYAGNNGIQWTVNGNIREGQVVPGSKNIAFGLNTIGAQSGTISGGISAFSVKIRNNAAPGNNRVTELLINGDVIESITDNSEEQVYEFTVEDLDIEGDFTMAVRNASPMLSDGRMNFIAIDEISWNSNTSLSNSDFDFSELKLYPNPVKNTLRINVPNTVKLNSAKLYSVTGQEIINTKNHDIDMSGLKSGMYLLMLDTNEGTVTKKVIKQ